MAQLDKCNSTEKGPMPRQCLEVSNVGHLSEQSNHKRKIVRLVKQLSSGKMASFFFFFFVNVNE